MRSIVCACIFLYAFSLCTASLQSHYTGVIWRICRLHLKSWSSGSLFTTSDQGHRHGSVSSWLILFKDRMKCFPYKNIVHVNWKIAFEVSLHYCLVAKMSLCIEQNYVYQNFKGIMTFDFTELSGHDIVLKWIYRTDAPNTVFIRISP